MKFHYVLLFLLHHHHRQQFFLFVSLVFSPSVRCGHHDYSDALSKSILFFEGQRSGVLPRDQRMKWREHSGLSDGRSMYNMDLTGGYYDAGDNVKFGFPMAFTTTMLAWSVIEFGELMPPSELRNALVAIRWGTDYLLKLSLSLTRFSFRYLVGDPYKDHNCWERPEDMDTARTVYAVDAPNRLPNGPGYAQTLLRNSVRVFQYADNFRGAYSDNSNVRDGACPFYCDFSGSTAWLRRASQDNSYLNYIEINGKTLGADDNIMNLDGTKACWKHVLLQSYKVSADSFMCTLIPDSSSSHIEYTPGGLIYKPGGSNLQHATTISFLPLNCGNLIASPLSLRTIAKNQADYILGDNPMGYRSSLPSVKDHPEFIACKEGPGEDDVYDDDRADFRKSEPTTYINAPFVGVLAYFAANPS
ncbi:hypothetical protein V6Z11_1Z038500 [Gossypium hirsutum]